MWKHKIRQRGEQRLDRSSQRCHALARQILEVRKELVQRDQQAEMRQELRARFGGFLQRENAAQRSLLGEGEVRRVRQILVVQAELVGLRITARTENHLAHHILRHEVVDRADERRVLSDQHEQDP